MDADVASLMREGTGSSAASSSWNWGKRRNAQSAAGTGSGVPVQGAWGQRGQGEYGTAGDRVPTGADLRGRDSYPLLCQATSPVTW